MGSQRLRYSVYAKQSKAGCFWQYRTSSEMCGTWKSWSGSWSRLPPAFQVSTSLQLPLTKISPIGADSLPSVPLTSYLCPSRQHVHTRCVCVCVCFLQVSLTTCQLRSPPLSRRSSAWWRLWTRRAWWMETWSTPLTSTGPSPRLVRQWIWQQGHHLVW